MNLRARLAALGSYLPKMAIDACLFALAYVLAFVARLETVAPPYDLTLWVTLPFVVALQVAVYLYGGSYRGIWRYSSLTDIEELLRGTLFSGLVLAAASFLLPPELPMPRSVPFIDMVLALLFTGAVRLFVRVSHESSQQPANGRTTRAQVFGRTGKAGARRALIVGAGDAGEMIVREIRRSTRMDYDPVAFVDDDPVKRGQSIHGVRVLGGRERIPDLVKELAIDDILIAIPTAKGRDVSRLVEISRNTAANLKILPDLSKIMDGQVRVSDLRKVEITDLLGRETAELDLFGISSYLRGKRVLVTGAGGSIGAELCRQILNFGPSEIHLMGRGENSIYEIHEELRQKAGFSRIVQVIGDVINKKKLEGVFAMYRPQIVFHAGADKHVPLMEANPDEAVFNNVLGTRNVLEVSNRYRIERVVCISTDKAVNPTSVMGACKRVAELLVQSRLYPDTVGVAVRFGNVLGSRGSVIPLFHRQIQRGGPITITHREIKRYFMTIPEAAGLVIQAGTLGRGGEIFVLDMGEPVKIWELAANMVRLAGLKVNEDIEIRETGLRPGEKLDEELFLESEAREATSHRKIHCVRGNGVDEGQLLAEIERLVDRALHMDYAGIRDSLHRLVPEYRRGVDLSHLPKAAGRES